MMIGLVHLSLTLCFTVINDEQVLDGLADCLCTLASILVYP